MAAPLIRDQTPDDVQARAMARSPQHRFPWAGQFELTCRCNLKCVMCYTDCFNTPDRIQDELTTGEVIRILDELQAAGCVELTLTGGEPLARPDFTTIYEQAHARGFLLTVFTNGTLITPRVADLWAAARPVQVEISVHALSAEVFDAVTQVSGSLERCLAGIEMLRARGVPVVVKTVGLTTNSAAILAVKQWADRQAPGVTWRFGQYLRDDLAYSGSPYQYQLPEETLVALDRQDPQLWRAKCDEMAQSRPDAGCGGGRITFHIDARGRLQLCSNNRHAGFDLRTGPFSRGFWEALPTFPCRGRRFPNDPAVIPLRRHEPAAPGLHAGRSRP
jgi:MoaA/NifB/PqqE/SkfB family radical SAM enzyme